MKSLNSQEYLQLLEKLVELQYSNDEEFIGESAEKYVWTPADSEIKERIKKLTNNQKFIDLTAVKKDKLKDLILDYQNLVIGPFRVCINDYFPQPGGEVNLHLYIYEEKLGLLNPHTKTHNKITGKVDVLKDMRFETRSWKTYFNDFKAGSHIPINDAVEIVRWLQAIHKLSAFI